MDPGLVFAADGAVECFDEGHVVEDEVEDCGVGVCGGMEAKSCAYQMRPRRSEVSRSWNSRVRTMERFWVKIAMDMGLVNGRLMCAGVRLKSSKELMPYAKSASTAGMFSKRIARGRQAVCKIVFAEEWSERSDVRVGMSLLTTACAASQRRCLTPVQVVSRFIDAFPVGNPALSQSMRV